MIGVLHLNDVQVLQSMYARVTKVLVLYKKEERKEKSDRNVTVSWQQISFSLCVYECALKNVCFLAARFAACKRILQCSISNGCGGLPVSI